MKGFITASLLILALPLFAAPKTLKEVVVRDKSIPDHVIIKKYTNEPQSIHDNLLTRSVDYPTQIVRMDAELSDKTLNCDQVQQTIDDFFSNQIKADYFFYNTITYCIYDPDTELATRFSINSYFDPLTDKAIDYLQLYLAEHNGQNLLGSPFVVENAKGVIVSLNVDAGKEMNRQSTVLLRYRHDNATHYFNNNYRLIKTLISDIHQRFYSNDQSVVLPFFETWFPFAGGYESVLQASNYVELQPERIFLMDKEPTIFTPHLKLYYAHHCSVYPNKRCL